MICPHVHFRDWNQSDKETLKHGIDVFYRAGYDGAFEMPNTDPALTSKESIVERLSLGQDAVIDLKEKHGWKTRFFYGIYAGVTSDPKQIEEVVETYNDFLNVVGLKMFAGHSTGNMGITEEEEQKKVYELLAKLGYEGVLAVHCEKEKELRPHLWDYKKPITHTLARPPIAELQSGIEQLTFAEESGFEGTLHICHISVPELVDNVQSKNLSELKFKITCGATPHHCLLHDNMMKEENGIHLKMNPPLRSKESQTHILNDLINGRIDWIETDHAPHTLEQKMNSDSDSPFASGIPVVPIIPFFFNMLINHVSKDFLHDITHNNIAQAFGLENIPNSFRAGKQTEQEVKELFEEYEFNPFKNI